MHANLARSRRRAQELIRPLAVDESMT